MGKVTSKLQVTVPRAIADRFSIVPGDELAWMVAGEGIRIVPANQMPTGLGMKERLALFDEATERQRRRQGPPPQASKARNRGWTREELYRRGRSR